MAVAALTIAGSDSGGGAGIQADLKTFSALGVYGCSAITAITAQNTVAVTAVHAVPLNIVREQIRAVLTDINISAIKIGMLATPDIIMAVAEEIAAFNGPIVLDPVMVAKSGDVLLQPLAISALVKFLVPRATVITPNLPEAAELLGTSMAKDEAMIKTQGKALIAAGAKAVLMKGGHAKGETCRDLLLTAQGESVFEAKRIDTRNTHGTGCSLSSAIAAELAKGATLETAVGKAHAWLNGAIRAADRLHIGHGHGPVHHFHEIWK